MRSCHLAIPLCCSGGARAFIGGQHPGRGLLCFTSDCSQQEGVQFGVVQVPGAGRGVVALVDLPPGVEVLREAPVVCQPALELKDKVGPPSALPCILSHVLHACL